LIDLPGGSDLGAPKLSGVFEPNRVPQFVRAYKRYDWNWNESAPPPYGSRGGVNDDDQAPVAVIDFGATPGEKIDIPERNATIWSGDIAAMVIYAGERELRPTLAQRLVVELTPNAVYGLAAQMERTARPSVPSAQSAPKIR
jgi:hypothetical protein